MSGAHISPEKITKAIQLPAVWLAGLVLLVAAFLTAATQVENPSWLPAMFGVAAVASVIVFAGLILLLPRLRPHLQDDEYYADWLRRQEQRFESFSVEVTQNPTVPEVKTEASGEDGIEQRRLSLYQVSRGLFLVHTARPSRVPGQTMDIVVDLCQHLEGPLTYGTVERVTYQLGPKFPPGSIVKDRSTGFSLDISAYGPLLCLARVEFSDNCPPIEIYRYLDF